MATQTVDEVKNDMLTEKANHAELDILDSDSNTAIWRLWMYIQAVVIVMFEELMDKFKSDVQTIIDGNQYGNDQWWYNKVLAYQHGDLLVFLNNIYQYPAIDSTKQIIKFCSITGQGGKVQIKAAASAGGSPTVLNNDQLNGLVDYCEQIRPSGIKFTVQSLQADDLRMYLNVYYNASGDINVIRTNIKAAIQNYLSTLNTTNFDGTLYVNKLIDAIQAVPGIVGPQVEVLSIAAKNGADAYQSFTSSYYPKSGYFSIDPAFDLDTTITYLT